MSKKNDSLYDITDYVMEDAKKPNSTYAALNGVEYWEILFTLKSGIGWIGPGFAYISGVILDIVLTIMVICSMPFVRRSGHFQVQYFFIIAKKH